MRLSWGLFIDSALLFFILLAQGSVLLRGDQHTSPDEIQRLPSSQGRNESDSVSIDSVNAIIKRYDEPSDDLRIQRINILTGSVPIAVAASSLETFYNAILFNARNAWCTLPPQHDLVMSMGPVQLTMSVVLDDGLPQGIPWDFVRNFARNLLAMTAMGFTGTYNMYYSTDYGFPTLGVEVRLRILWGT